MHQLPPPSYPLCFTMEREKTDPFPTGDWEPVNSTEQKPVTTLPSNYLLAWQNSPWKAQIPLPPQFDAIMASYS